MTAPMPKPSGRQTKRANPGRLAMVRSASTNSWITGLLSPVRYPTGFPSSPPASVTNLRAAFPFPAGSGFPPEPGSLSPIRYRDLGASPGEGAGGGCGSDSGLG